MSRWKSAGWLLAFRATGGMAWMIEAGVMGIGWKIHGYTLDQHAEARRLYGQIENDRRRWHAVLNRVATGG